MRVKWKWVANIWTRIGIIYSRTSPLIKVIVYSKVANGGLPTFLNRYGLGNLSGQIKLIELFIGKHHCIFGIQIAQSCDSPPPWMVGYHINKFLNSSCRFSHFVFSISLVLAELGSRSDWCRLGHRIFYITQAAYYFGVSRIFLQLSQITRSVRYRFPHILSKTLSAQINFSELYVLYIYIRTNIADHNDHISPLEWLMRLEYILNLPPKISNQTNFWKKYSNPEKTNIFYMTSKNFVRNIN